MTRSRLVSQLWMQLIRFRGMSLFLMVWISAQRDRPVYRDSCSFSSTCPTLIYFLQNMNFSKLWIIKAWVFHCKQTAGTTSMKRCMLYNSLLPRKPYTVTGVFAIIESCNSMGRCLFYDFFAYGACSSCFIECFHSNRSNKLEFISQYPNHGQPTQNCINQMTTLKSYSLKVPVVSLLKRISRCANWTTKSRPVQMPNLCHPEVAWPNFHFCNAVPLSYQVN